MREILFTIYRSLGAFAVLLASGAAQGGAEPLQEVLVVGDAGRLEVRLSIEFPDSPEALKALEEFRDTRLPLGAFAVAPDGAFGKTFAAMSLRQAEQRVLEACRQTSQDCAIFATKSPEGVADPDRLVANLVLLMRLAFVGTDAAQVAVSAAPSGVVGMEPFETNAGRAQVRANTRCRKLLTHISKAAVPQDQQCRPVRLHFANGLTAADALQSIVGDTAG